MLTAWNWVAFHGSRVFGSEVIPMTRLPPGAPAAPVVSDVDGVPLLHPATRTRVAAPAITPRREERRRYGAVRGDMRGTPQGAGVLPQKYSEPGSKVTFRPPPPLPERRPVGPSR